MTTLTQRFRLRGVHFLYDPVYNEPKHGHEYELHVTVDAKTQRDVLQSTVEKEILSQWDKTDFMKKKLAQASGELLVEEFDRLLRESPLKESLIAVVLKETRKNRFVSRHSKLLGCE
jgi:6-pyruvoyl-tetrahydropterin synthase